ncbi:MAG: DUF3750 domain-containing protein [Pseudomonadota bacterium]
MIAVELRGARVPVVGWFAHHYFFVICEGARRERWEVWQRAERCASSAGHVHRDLLPWRAGVGFGPSFLVKRWEGSRALLLADRLRASLTAYPERGRYRFWPGPNSNSFAQWVLGSDYPLPWPAIGARFRVRDR